MSLGGSPRTKATFQYRLFFPAANIFYTYFFPTVTKFTNRKQPSTMSHIAHMPHRRCAILQIEVMVNSPTDRAEPGEGVKPREGKPGGEAPRGREDGVKDMVKDGMREEDSFPGLWSPSELCQCWLLVCFESKNKLFCEINFF